MTIYVDRGNGDQKIDDWTELWEEMFSALAYSIRFAADGKCSCGCTVQICCYCVGECT